MFKAFYSLDRRHKTNCFYVAFGFLVFFVPILENLKGAELVAGIISALAFNFFVAAYYYAYKLKAQLALVSLNLDENENEDEDDIFDDKRSFGEKEIDIVYYDFDARSTKDI